jgi:hypothetical protein
MPRTVIVILAYHRHKPIALTLISRSIMQEQIVRYISGWKSIDTQNHWLCGLCSSSGILNTRKQNIGAWQIELKIPLEFSMLISKLL